MDSNDPLYFQVAVNHNAFSTPTAVFVCNPPRERSEPSNTELWGLGIDLDPLPGPQNDPSVEFYSDPYVHTPKPQRRRAQSRPPYLDQMPMKRRSTAQAILVPTFLQGASSIPDSPDEPSTSLVTPPETKRASRIRSHSSASLSTLWGLSNHTHYPPQQLVSSPIPIGVVSPPTSVTSPSASPPPDFLLDDDPFADLTSAPAIARNNSTISSPPPPPPETIPTSPPPRSPLMPLGEETSAQTAARVDVPGDFDGKKPQIPRALTTRILPVAAHQRPAFSPRPSLPSLSTLAQMNVVLTKKPRKGRVGAGLPFEPWDNPTCELPPRVLQDIHATSTQSLPVGTQPLLPSQIVGIAASAAAGGFGRVDRSEVSSASHNTRVPPPASESATLDDNSHSLTPVATTPSALSHHVALKDCVEQAPCNTGETPQFDRDQTDIPVSTSTSSSESGHGNLLDSYYSGESSDPGHGEEDDDAETVLSDEGEHDEQYLSFAAYQQYQHYADFTDFDTDSTTTASNSCDEFSPPSSSRVSSSFDASDIPVSLSRSLSSSSSQADSALFWRSREEQTEETERNRMSAVVDLENQLRISLEGALASDSASTSGTRSSLDESDFSLRSPADFLPLTLSPKSSSSIQTPSLTSSASFSSGQPIRNRSTSSTSSAWTGSPVIGTRSPSQSFSSLFGFGIKRKERKKSSANSSMDYVSSWRDQHGKEVGSMGSYLSDLDLSDPISENEHTLPAASTSSTASAHPLEHAITIPTLQPPHEYQAPVESGAACAMDASSEANGCTNAVMLGAAGVQGGSPGIPIPPTGCGSDIRERGDFLQVLEDEQQVWPSSADTVRPAPLSASGAVNRDWARAPLNGDDDGCEGSEDLGGDVIDGCGGAAVIIGREDDGIDFCGQMRDDDAGQSARRINVAVGEESPALGFDPCDVGVSSFSAGSTANCTPFTDTTTTATTGTSVTATTLSSSADSLGSRSTSPSTLRTTPVAFSNLGSPPPTFNSVYNNNSTSPLGSVSGSLSPLSSLSALERTNSTSSLHDLDLGTSTSSRGLSSFRERLQDEQERDTLVVPNGPGEQKQQKQHREDSLELDLDLDLGHELGFDSDKEGDLEMLRYQGPRASATSAMSSIGGRSRMVGNGGDGAGSSSSAGYRSRAHSHSNNQESYAGWSNGGGGRYNTVGSRRGGGGAGGDDEDDDRNEDRRRRLHQGPESLAHGAYSHAHHNPRSQRASAATSEDEGEFGVGVVPRVPLHGHGHGVGSSRELYQQHQQQHQQHSAAAPSSSRYGGEGVGQSNARQGPSSGGVGTRFPVSTSNSSSDDDDDDVPLAQRISNPLVVQKSIRRQVREERQVQKLERAATTARSRNGSGRGEQDLGFSRDRHATLRPAGAGGPASGSSMPMSSSQEAAMHAFGGVSASSASSMVPGPPPVPVVGAVPAERKARQRTMTMPSQPGPPPMSGGTRSPFCAEDLASRLQSVQMAAEQQQQQYQHHHHSSQALGSAPAGASQFQPQHHRGTVSGRGSYDAADRTHALARGRTMKESGSSGGGGGGGGLRHMRSFHREKRTLDEWGDPAPALPSDAERQAALHRQYSRSGSRVREDSGHSPQAPRKRSLSISRRPGSPHGYAADENAPPVPPLPMGREKMGLEDQQHHGVAPRKLYKPSRTSGDGGRPERSPAGVSVPLPGGSGGGGGGQVVQQRVFVGDMQRFNMVEITSATTAGEVVEMIEAQGALSGRGWMVFEVAQDFGMERPIRSFELLSDVQASWNKDKMVNLFVVKQTPLAAALSRTAIPTSSPIYSGYVEWEQKRGKWSKRWMTLREHSLWLSKREGKEEVLLCSLSNFDAYFVSRSHRAPKPFSFAVKSTDSLTFFENAADYLHNFSCNEANGKIWMEKILIARSYVLHQERQVLFNPKAAGGNASAGLSRANTTRKSTTQRPIAPLVSVPPIAFSTQQLPQHGKEVFAPGSLLHNQP